jgi:hypothetical protein
LQADVPLGDKTFSRFQNGKKTESKFETPVSFPTPIKWKVYSIGPLGSCIRSIPPGDKTFLRFSKDEFPSINLIV